MLVIGLTGGIASGKSEATRYLNERYGVPIIDGDEIVHRLYDQDGELQDELVEVFGRQVLTKEGSSIDRQALAALTFNDPSQLEKLNAIVHPRVYAEFEEQINTLEEASQEEVIASSPLHLETGFYTAMQELIIVLCDPDLQRQRLRDDRGLSDAEIDKRLAVQWTNDQRREITSAHFVENNGTLEQFHAQLDALPLFKD